MSGRERTFVDRAFDTNWLSTVGPNLDHFEQAMAAHLGGGVHTLAVSSGTAALHLVLRAAGVGPGDVVAVSSLTFVGSVWPILYLGATPVFIDSERESWNMDPDLVDGYLRTASRQGRLPKALVLVHLYGQHADVDRISTVCAEYGVIVVEDAAESLGATYRGRQTATSTPYGILSFNGNKIMTTSGGGMVVCQDSAQLARMRQWANQSREPTVEYLHTELGYNYRLSNVLAGIGIGQLEVLGERVAARRRVAARYADAFAGVPGVTMQSEASWTTHTRWLSVVQLDPRLQPTAPREIVERLERVNIETRPVWRPMHTQPVFRDAERIGGQVAEELFATGLCLPSSSSLNETDQDRVLDALMSALAEVPSSVSSR